jgi:hypothetical protein
VLASFGLVEISAAPRPLFSKAETGGSDQFGRRGEEQPAVPCVRTPSGGGALLGRDGTNPGQVIERADAQMITEASAPAQLLRHLEFIRSAAHSMAEALPWT